MKLLINTLKISAITGLSAIASRAEGAEKTSAPPSRPRITYEGNTVFTPAELDAVIQPLLRKYPLTHQALEQIRSAISHHYVDSQYINSGATIPTFDPTSGEIKVKIIEGTVTVVSVRGNRWTKESAIADRIQYQARGPLNVAKLRDALELLRLNYPLAHLSSKLEPGGQPGEARLDIRVAESPRARAGVRFRNDQPASSGGNQVEAVIESPNLSGRFDDLGITFGVYRFGKNQHRFLDASNYSIAYRIPVSRSDLRFGAFWRKSSTSVQEEPFDVLGISSRAEIAGLSLERPFTNTLRRQTGVALVAEHKTTQTYLFGRPFSFSPNAVDGRTKVTPLRVSTWLIDRNEQRVFSARLTASGGLDLLDATPDTQANGARFLLLSGQLHFLHRIGARKNALVLRLSGQWSRKPLISTEQFVLGGSATVRGYRENSLVRDVGLASSLEFRLPVFATDVRRDWLEIAPFFDVGAGWFRAASVRAPNNISSVGIALYSRVGRTLEASFAWGYGLRRLNNGRGDLQDAGIHLNFTYWLR